MDSKNQAPAMDSKNPDPAMDSKNQAPANGELKDGELDAVTGGLGGNLAAAVLQGVVTGMMNANGPAKGDLK
jgi:hypothetical protein